MNDCIGEKGPESQRGLTNMCSNVKDHWFLPSDQPSHHGEWIADQSDLLSGALQQVLHMHKQRKSRYGVVVPCSTTDARIFAASAAASDLTRSTSTVSTL